MKRLKGPGQATWTSLLVSLRRSEDLFAPLHRSWQRYWLGSRLVVTRL